MYMIDLGNGTMLENLMLNGNNFVSQTEVKEEDFEGMETIVITNDEDNSVRKMNNVILISLSCSTIHLTFPHLFQKAIVLNGLCAS